MLGAEGGKGGEGLANGGCAGERGESRGGGFGYEGVVEVSNLFAVWCAGPSELKSGGGEQMILTRRSSMPGESSVEEKGSCSLARAVGRELRSLAGG